MPLINKIFLSPTELRLRLGWRLLAQLILLGLLMFVFTLPVGVLIFLFGLSQETLLLIGQVVSVVAVTLSVFLARRLFDRRSIASLGLHIRRRSLADLLAGAAIGGLMMALIFALEWALGWLHLDGFTWQVQPAWQVLLGTLGWLFAFFLVGWQEELYFRGYLLQNLMDGLGLIIAALLSSLVFSLLHLANPGSSLSSTLGLLAAGLFFAFAYLRTRQLWLPIGLHIGWNFFESTVFGFPVSGLDVYKLSLLRVNGPPLWTGGSFGPEAGLVLLPGLALGALLIFGYTKASPAPMAD
jgi:membrane protease YdiL (CAAX protease family)